MKIPVGSRKCYNRFGTAWTEEAKEAVNLKFEGVVDLIKVEDADITPGLSYATPRQFVEVFGVNRLEAHEASSLALSAMLYNPNEEWSEGEYVRVRTCSSEGPALQCALITKEMLNVYRADLRSIRRGDTRTITDDTYGYCYKRGKRRSIFVACGSALVSEGMVVCCRCTYRTLEKNVHVNKMDVRTQQALKSVITTTSWYCNRNTITRTALLYVVFFLSILSFGLLLHLEQYEIAVSVIIPGLTSCYYALTWIAGLGDTGLLYALTFRGSRKRVTSHINMKLGNQGKQMKDPRASPTNDHLIGTYVIDDQKMEKAILKFVSAAMCTTKMREVLRPSNSCALGTNMGVKTFWDIVMTSKRIRALGCLLTNKFYVVHTASGLKAFEVNSVSTTARHTNWREIVDEMVGIVELDHVILG